MTVKQLSDEACFERILEAQPRVEKALVAGLVAAGFMDGLAKATAATFVRDHARREAGWPLADIAADLGVSERHLSRCRAAVDALASGAGRDELRRAADELGLDREPIEPVAEQAPKPEPAPAPVRVSYADPGQMQVFVAERDRRRAEVATNRAIAGGTHA